MLVKQSWYVDLKIINECAESFPDQEKLVLNEPTGDFFYDPWILKKEYIGTVWEKVLSTLPCTIGEARVIKLTPGETYMAHADIDDRWHLNLSGNRSYLIDLDKDKMYLLQKDQFWYSMSADKIHVAANFGSINRLQLVVRQLLKKSVSNELVAVTVKPYGKQIDYRYKFDNILSPFLNRADKLGYIKDFKFIDDTVTFKLCKTQVDNFEKLLTDSFKVIYA